LRASSSISPPGSAPPPTLEAALARGLEFLAQRIQLQGRESAGRLSDIVEILRLGDVPRYLETYPEASPQLRAALAALGNAP